MASVYKPTKEEVRAAAGRTVPDVIAPGLRVLFCGINPGLYTAAVGHHFARPGNRFWPALHRSGFTERLLSPFEERELLARGLGVTNVVARATAAAAELAPAEFERGGRTLRAKVKQYRPRFLAVLGVGAYRAAFVLSQYIGYLRRNPNDAPEPSLDYSGFDFWLSKLDSFSLPGEDVRNPTTAQLRAQRAEMVRAFILSAEYRGRFGQP